MTIRIKGSQARSLQTRAEILSAVEGLLARRSFDDITLSDIAAAAGIAKGSVLAHFSEKLSILASFLADAMDRTTDALAADPGCASEAGRLVTVVLPLIDFLKTDRALARLLAVDGEGTQCAAILDPALARLGAGLGAVFAASGQPDPALAAEVAIALAVHVAVAAECHAGDEAAAALTRLLGVLYR